MMTVQYSMVIAHTLEQSPFYPILVVYVFLVFPVTTLLTALALTYLFSYQASRTV